MNRLAIPSLFLAKLPKTHTHYY